MTFKEFVEQNCATDEIEELAKLLNKAYLGADAHEVSLLSVLWYIKQCKGTKRFFSGKFNNGQLGLHLELIMEPLFLAHLSTNRREWCTRAKIRRRLTADQRTPRRASWPLTSPARQARYTNQAARRAHRDPNARQLELLVSAFDHRDEPGDAGQVSL